MKWDIHGNAPLNWPSGPALDIGLEDEKAKEIEHPGVPGEDKQSFTRGLFVVVLVAVGAAAIVTIIEAFVVMRNLSIN